MFARLITLKNELFDQQIDASVLDNRVEFYCEPKEYSFN